MTLLRLYRRTGPYTETCFTVEATAPLTADERRRLVWLCAETFEPDGTAGTSFLDGRPTVEVGPRLTIETPFSSNAVAICRAMGLDKVVRIETSRRAAGPAADRALAASLDRMTEAVWPAALDGLRVPASPAPVRRIPLLARGPSALDEANRRLGLGMDEWDLAFYARLFTDTFRRDPTDVELFQLGQSNSEHSRHWYFKGVQEIDGVALPDSLFDIVQAPLRALGAGSSLVAFRDNGGVIRGFEVDTLAPAAPDRPSAYRTAARTRHIVCTAETHNHPTLVSPFPGAATGTGGMLRDLSAVGRGSVAGLSAAGYFVGNLFLPGHDIAGEAEGADAPSAYASPRDILVEGSNGVSAYGNEVGIPTTLGFTRSFGQVVDGEWLEPRKPVLYCAGLGEIDDAHLAKAAPEPGLLIVQIGGPAYPIGVGGGGASSMAQGENEAELDFRSVQRGNPEMENRALRVLRACVELGEANPIASLHDQGAGGPGNVLPELVEPLGGTIDIRRINVGDSGMSVLEIWSGEYQERFGLLLRAEALPLFEALCARERVPCEVLGAVADDGRIVVVDTAADPAGGADAEAALRPVDLDLEPILTHVPQKTFRSERRPRRLAPLSLPAGLDAAEALEAVFSLPQVGSKGFLVHKADRCVTGLVARQQCCGPLGLPVANLSVRASGFSGTTGAAWAIGEQPAKMLVDPAAGARMAVGEMLTNLVSARITALSDVRVRANWMWPAKLPGEGPRLYDAAAAMRDAMVALGIAVDGGKDSLSMAATAAGRVAKSPGQLVLLGYAPVPDIGRVLTPDLKAPGASVLALIDLGGGRDRLGGSALAQAFGQIGDEVPDLDDPDALRRAFESIQAMIDRGLLLSLHDRSDGGLVTAAVEMALSGACGLRLNLGPDAADPLARLFAEELGLLLEIRRGDEAAVASLCRDARLPYAVIGETVAEGVVEIAADGRTILARDTATLARQWSATSLRLEQEQTDPACARAEAEAAGRTAPPFYRLTFTPGPTAPALLERGDAPRVAVLRDEGTNGDREMAAACRAAGMAPWDVAMTDLLTGRIDLAPFRAVLFCGGFSFMDVFGSGKGWAGVIRFNERLRAQFDAFYDRVDTLSLGACNGCQLMALLGWVPGRGVADAAQPRFVRNASGRFESRWSRVRVLPSPAVHLAGMEDSVLGIWSEHGEGRLVFPDPALRDGLAIPLAYVDAAGEPTDRYPDNPNGSPGGAAALCSADGRHLALMPHPERCFLPWQCEWLPPGWRGHGAAPWLRLFQNMRAWLDAHAA